MNVYQIITDRIIALLQEGTVAWHKPWDPAQGAPRNLVSKKPYRGINVFLLMGTRFSSPYWLTFRQAQELGGSVKAGSKATPVVFWKLLQRTRQDDAADSAANGERNEDAIPLIRYYSVFNLDQINGIPSPNPSKEPFIPLTRCEEVVAGMPAGPAIQHQGTQAYYSPQEDLINMPPKEVFKDAEGYYSTIFHEMTHSTGHKTRLNRPGITDICRFGETNYSKEELVAEMGAAFLCGVTGIQNQTIDNSTSYIANWLKRLDDDTKLVVHAAAQAQKAVDYILGFKEGEVH